MGTTSNPHEIVSFDRPPVEEVALAVQFVEAQLSLGEMVDIGRALSSDFPVQQLQPQAPRMMVPTPSPSFSFSTQVGVPLPRLWFVSSDGTRLFQVQEDRVVFNWRRLGSSEPYPRYSRLREELMSHLERLEQVAPSLTDARWCADFCEVTYVNELEAPPLEGPSLQSVLRVFAAQLDAEFLGAPEESRWNGQWTIRDPDGEPAGSLSASAQPTIRRRDGHPINLLTMTAALPGTTLGRASTFCRLDLGHEWIVRGFADLTTKAMHERWGRSR